MKLADKIAGFFVVNGIKWGSGEKAFIPTGNDIQKALDSIATDLVEYDDGTELEVGRLLVVKRGGHLDVFVHFGDINDPNS